MVDGLVIRQFRKVHSLGTMNATNPSIMTHWNKKRFIETSMPKCNAKAARTAYFRVGRSQRPTGNNASIVRAPHVAAALNQWISNKVDGTLRPKLSVILETCHRAVPFCQVSPYILLIAVDA